MKQAVKTIFVALNISFSLHLDHVLDKIDETQTQENALRFTRCAFHKNRRVYRRGSLYRWIDALIDWTVTNEPRLIARGNIRQQKPGKAHIADP
jgi:hypothetical protein